MAEGGMYPSVGKLLGLLLACAFFIPAAITAVVYGIIKLIQPLKKPSKTIVFGAAWLTWVAVLVALLSGVLDLYASETEVGIAGGVASFAVALFAAFRSAKGKQIDPYEGQ